MSKHNEHAHHTKSVETPSEGRNATHGATDTSASTQPSHWREDAHAGHIMPTSGAEKMTSPYEDHGAHHDEAPKAGHSGHVGHTGHELLFRNRFWVCLLLTLPVLLYSHMLQMWFGFTMPSFSGSQWIAPLFALFIFAYGGVPFLQMAAPEVQNWKPGMMLLISLAISVALLYSVAALWIDPTGGFFWEMALLIDVMLLGHWLEMRSVRQASGALNELAKLLPDEAERIEADGSVIRVTSAELRMEDRVLVRPGASVPADGVVEEGASEVNEAMITGESQPVKKQVGAKVIAGTINGDSSLRVRVTAIGESTALAGIMRLVKQAQESKSNTQILADRAAGWLFYIALAVALLTAIAWTLITGFNLAVLQRVATVLVIACPHALGLAVPLVVAISTSLAARNGILVRDRLALEEARNIATVIFDKTGTLTKGEQGLVNLAVATGWSEKQALALAAAVEGDSEHIIAKAIRKAAQERTLMLPAISDFAAIKGRGARAIYNGQAVYVGGPRLLEMLALTPASELQPFATAADDAGRTVVYLVVEKTIIAAFALADLIRPESKPAIAKLHALGIEVVMLTGDSKAVAKAVADELGIDRFIAEVLPEHKDAIVQQLQAGVAIQEQIYGQTLQNPKSQSPNPKLIKVAMVGDGVNDAPALTRADIGIAIGSGTDVAVESADIVLVNSNPQDVTKIFTLSRATRNKMIQNLWWAAGYNIVALPLAAGILAGWSINLSPAIGALLMSVSTIVVAINAQLLRRVNLGSA